MADSHPPVHPIPEIHLNAGLEWWRLWSDFGARLMQAGLASPAQPTPAAAVGQWRSALLQELAQSTDEYLRSPPFLEAMRVSLGQAVDWRRQFNEVFGRLHHELQGVSRQDLDQLMDALNHVERRMSDNFERLTEQLQQFEQRLAPAAPVARRPRRRPQKGAPAQP